MRAEYKLSRRLRRFASNEQGVQLVELAIVLPILVLLLATITEFGRFFYTYTTLAKATRVGARYLSTAAPPPAGTPDDPSPPGPKDGVARNLMVYGQETATGATPILPNFSADANVNIEVDRSDGDLPTLPLTVTVRIVNYQYKPIFDPGALTGLSSLSLGNINISPSTTMRYFPNAELAPGD